jgi:hypothetical protein
VLFAVLFEALAALALAVAFSVLLEGFTGA